MTKGGSNKTTMLGRLIFGEKRKQHASPSRHRSVTRNGSSLGDVPSSSGVNGMPHKNIINLHEWAIWRMHVNEQMGHGMPDRGDLKHMRQFLHSNPFYQQHSRDPSSGRYNGVRLLFSIPHPKIKPESIEIPRESTTLSKITNLDVPDTTTYDQTNVFSNDDDRTFNGTNSISIGSPTINHKSLSQPVQKTLLRNTSCYQPMHDPTVPTNVARTQRPIRAPFTAPDRVHGTLQKAVKDGNVLEKIKAFEMQAAAAQADTTLKLGGTPGLNNRTHIMASPIQSIAQRALSPPVTYSLQQSISPMPMQYESPQQYNRSHRSRQIHPTHGYHDFSVGPMVGRQSRKGSHVLEPAVGDIILRRATPSQQTANDEDYSMTLMSSMALPLSQGHSYRQQQHHRHHHHHRTSVSRSRHRKETPHERRASSVHEHVSKKSQQKQKQKQKEKETKPSTSSKTSTRHRWLKVHKDTPTEKEHEDNKKDTSTSKFSKLNKSKKKNNNEQEKSESKDQVKASTTNDKVSSDNNRVYGVPNTNIEATSPQSPSRIDEENESDREKDEKLEYDASTIQEEISENKQFEINIERQSSNTEPNVKSSAIDGENLSKVEDDNRFSRPTDDHAHRSELNDEDEECKSEGDVFVEDLSLPNMNSSQLQQPLAHAIRRHSSQCSADKIPLDRRWQWSKESGGLIDKGNPKKKQQKSTSSLTSKEDRIIYETPKSEQIQTSSCNNHVLSKKQSFTTIVTHENNDEQSNNKQVTKQILHTILNSMANNQEQADVNEFFENGPYTNPEDVMANIASTA